MFACVVSLSVGGSGMMEGEWPKFGPHQVPGSGMLRFGLFLSSGLGFLEIVTHFNISFCVVKNLFSTQQNVSEGRSNISGFTILNVAL